MKTRTMLLAAAALLTMTGAQAGVYPGTTRTCKGEFTRVIGLTLGDCDLSSVFQSDVDYIKSKCGEPWAPGMNRKARKCSIQVIADPVKSLRNGAALYHVVKVRTDWPSQQDVDQINQQPTEMSGSSVGDGGRASTRILINLLHLPLINTDFNAAHQRAALSFDD